MFIFEVMTDIVRHIVSPIPLIEKIKHKEKCSLIQKVFSCWVNFQFIEYLH